MYTLLAQTPPAGFGSWLENTFYALGLITACVVLFQRLRPAKPVATEVGPQPLTVQGAARFTPLERHEKLEKRVDGIDERVTDQAVDLPAQIVAAFQAADNKRSTSIAGLHAKLERDVAQLNDRIDAVPGRVIQLLSETKELHRQR